MPGPIRFWGTVLSARPRLVLTKFEENTEASCPGYIATIDGTWTEGTSTPMGKTFTVAIGVNVFQNRAITAGDLVRGDAHPVPTELPDTPADLYKVGTLHVIQHGYAPLEANPPCTDAPLLPDAVVTAKRRPLAVFLLATRYPCHHCSHGVLACVVRVSDPRDYRRGSWMQVPACLGPEDCLHFQPRDQ
jgi:hypothetical protein